MMMGFGLLLLLLVGGAVVVVLLGGVGLLSRTGSNNRWPGGQHQPTARQILDERFVVRSARKNMKQPVRS